jgi:hypothetical protein
MVGTYATGLAFAAILALVLVAFKLRGSAGAVALTYNAFWMGAVFASGNGFAFGFEPEQIKILDGQWIILMALPQVILGAVVVIQQEIRTRRKIPKKPKAPARTTPRKGK